MTPTSPPRAGLYLRSSIGKQKSIGSQDTECTADTQDLGWQVAQRYTDKTSASRYANKAREDYSRLIDDIENGRLDAVTTWECSRLSRELEDWAGFLNRCRRRRVLIRVTEHGRTYDPRQARDYEALANDGVKAMVESDKLSSRIKRGQKDSAASGRPSHGRCPYGYVRTFDQTTGELADQVPDPTTAPVVRELIERVAKGTPLGTVARDLTNRGIPAPEGGRWWGATVSAIATNVAYAGWRKFNGERVRGTWVALVPDETLFAARATITSRLGSGRPGSMTWLLSGITFCAVCAGPMAGRAANVKAGLPARYGCRRDGHVYVDAAPFEELVLSYVLGRLAEPDVLSTLQQAGQGNDQAAEVLRGQIAGLRDRLAGFKAQAVAGSIQAADFADIAAGIHQQIETATGKLDDLVIPPVLRELTADGDLVQRWAGMPLAARKDVIGLLVHVTVRTGVRGQRQPVAERVTVAWRTS